MILIEYMCMNFYQECMLDFLKCLFSPKQNHMTFLLINYINRFSNIELALLSWIKTHLVMMYYSFYCAYGCVY